MARLRQKPMNGAPPEEKGSASTVLVEESADQRTDPRRWRMLDEGGRHTWHYLLSEEQAKAWPQSTADKWYLGLPTVSQTPTKRSSTAADSKIAGTAHAGRGRDTFSFSAECHFLLLPPATPTWQLGLRVWRSSVSSARSRDYVVCHQYANSRSHFNRDQKIPLRAAEPRRRRMGPPRRGRELGLRHRHELCCPSTTWRK